VPGFAPLTDRSQLQFRIGGVIANLAGAGLVTAGEYQINVFVPPGLAKRDQPIVATIGGVTSQSGFYIPVNR
jgi:uncharacterized protein (TIGR03437 family)